MKIHEFQAKEIFKEYGIPVPNGKVATTPSEVFEIAKGLNPPYAIKAQIHAGGRGKAGGIKIAKSPEEAKEAAESILGKVLVTHQTGPSGRLVRKVLVEEAKEIEKELYVGLVVDRAKVSPVIMASSEGGVDIEEVAAKSPEKIVKTHIDIATGFSPYQARKCGYGIGLSPALTREFTKIVNGMWRIFLENDASLVEINPLIITKDGQFLALDAKINFEDDALFRHPKLKELHDPFEEDPIEAEAKKYDIQYIKLDGNVGCMVNGAGLAMATMDLILHSGGKPANFLDVGGGASPEKVKNAIKIIVSDPNVKAVLINIFGGILRCDRVAKGLVDASREVSLNVPLVIRLEGTNMEEGRKILEESGINFQLASGLKDAAEKVSQIAKSL